MTTRIIENPWKRKQPNEDYRDKTSFQITSPGSGGKLEVTRNCNHSGDCTEDCPYVYTAITNWNGDVAHFSMSTEEFQEFIAAFLAIRKEAGLE